jgi:hypothetical protein
LHNLCWTIRSFASHRKADKSWALEFIATKTKVIVDKIDFNGKSTKKAKKKFELSRKHVAKVYTVWVENVHSLEVYLTQINY